MEGTIGSLHQYLERGVLRVSPASDQNPHLMLVGAFTEEVRFLTQSMRVDQEIKLSTGRVWIGEYRKRPVVVLKSGVGMKNATMSLSEVLETVCRPALVLSYGTAGALSLDLRIGELVLVDKLWVSSSTQVLNVEPELLEGARAWLHRSGIVYRQGGLVTSPGIVDQESNRGLLFHTYRALGVDMESAVICRMAKAYGLPFLCVRAISDRADGSLRNWETSRARVVLRGLEQSPRFLDARWL